MIRYYPPHPALKDFISRIILIRYELDPGKPRPINPFPPQPEHNLNFYLYDKVICHNYADQSTEEMPQSILIGPQLYRVDLCMGYHMLVISVGFHPGGMYRLLGIPMYELLDKAYDASLLLGRELKELIEQLHEVKDHDQMVTLIQDFLLRKARCLKISLPMDRALTHILQKGNLVNIDTLSQQACVSVRQLERQFKERIGMPPKQFTKLVRFSKAWNMRERNSCIRWSEIAHTCGFADQMHMIRDFKAFAGVTPVLLQTDLEKSPLRLQGEIG